MTLVPCRECTRHISADAAACPGCGAPEPGRSSVLSSTDSVEELRATVSALQQELAELRDQVRLLAEQRASPLPTPTEPAQPALSGAFASSVAEPAPAVPAPVAPPDTPPTSAGSAKTSEAGVGRQRGAVESVISEYSRRATQPWVERKSHRLSEEEEEGYEEHGYEDEWETVGADSLEFDEDDGAFVVSGATLGLALHFDPRLEITGFPVAVDIGESRFGPFAGLAAARDFVDLYDLMESNDSWFEDMDEG